MVCTFSEEDLLYVYCVACLSLLDTSVIVTTYGIFVGATHSGPICASAAGLVVEAYVLSTRADYITFYQLK